MERRAVPDDAGVVVLARPPIVYLVSILTGVGLGLVWPIQVVSRALEPPGALVVLLALGLFALSVRELRRAETPIRTRRSVRTVVRSGPYRISRNPIYLAFTLLQLGLGIWLNNLWIVALLVPTLVLISRGVIAREERYMAGRFGEEYRRYQASVRRWI